MSDMDNMFGRFVDQAGSKIGEALAAQISAQSGQGRPTASNPGNDDDDDGDDDDDDDGDVVGDGDRAIVYESGDTKLNLQLAAAAWRVRAGPDDFVAYHDGRKLSFFGNAEELISFCLHEDECDPEEWMVFERDEVLAIDADWDEMSRLLDDSDEEGMEDARKDFVDFQQGNEPLVDRIANIPGLTGEERLVQLGKAQKIQYYAPKGKKPTDYTHEFGEESKVLPTIYALGDKTLVIHGGNMHIEGRGIVD
jgi:hypothetical protein